MKVAAALGAAALLAAASPALAADPPTVTFTAGPENDAVVSASDVSFEFEVANASSTNCSLAGVGATSTSSYECSSPQHFTLPDGSYVFRVDADNPLGTSSVSRTFTMAAPSASDEESDGDSGSSGGGGFKRYPTPVVVTGAIIAGEDTVSGNVGGAGDLSDFPLVITPAPAPSSLSLGTQSPNTEAPRQSATPPRASAHVGGALAVDENAGSENAVSAATTTPAPAFIGTTSTGTLGAVGAAAAGSAAVIPGWLWFVLAAALLAALLYWAYRSSVGYDTTRR